MALSGAAFVSALDSLEQHKELWSQQVFHFNSDVDHNDDCNDDDFDDSDFDELEK